jgi:hypothetical protein
MTTVSQPRNMVPYYKVTELELHPENMNSKGGLFPRWPRITIIKILQE